MTAGAVGDWRTGGRPSVRTPEAPRPDAPSTRADPPAPGGPGRPATPPGTAPGHPARPSESPPSGQAVLDAILEAVTVGVVVHHRDGTPLLTNAAARLLLEGEPARTLDAMVAVAAERGRPGEPVVREITTGPDAATPGRAPARLHLSTVPLTLGDDRVAALVTTVREGATPGTSDVERRLGDALAIAERRLRATVEHSPVGTAIITPDGVFVQANAAMCRLLGRNGAQMRGLTLADVTHREDVDREATQLARLVRAEIDTYELEKRLVRPGGDSLWARVTVSAVRDDDRATEHLVVQALDVTETRLAVEMLTHQSLHDPLTGLPNRTLCLDRIQRALDRRRPAGSHLAVLSIDLDRFKVVNDSIGPAHGDAVLLEVTRRLTEVLRAGDTASRPSGDEFVVVCDDVSTASEAAVIADRVLAALRVPVVVDGRVVVPTASIGIAVSTDRDRDAMALLRDAGAALHRAKENGADSWALVDDELRRRAVDRFDIEHQLRSGLTRGELRLHLQPIVDVTTARIVGREALVRWQHPERGLLGPAWFLPVAEESGLIDDLGRWVLGEAARIAQACPELGYVAVNVSPSQVRRPGLSQDVEDVLARTGLPASQLVIELTESVMLGAATEGRRQLTALDELGVRLVVDDFGTGFSALSHLRDLPVSGIKVDRSFTAGLGRDPQCDRIVEALTGLAQGLGVDIVAEGVETEEQRAVLAGIGCEHAQGYLFGRPEPVELPA
jgi:diguanylate cyclase (GGDEF)-like protein/PAS domain S-box-containing protein